MLDPNLTTKEDQDEENGKKIAVKDLERYINLFDLKRLEAYTNNLSDYNLITDLIPTISRLFFNQMISQQIKLSYAQAAIMIGLGLQHKNMDTISGELKLPVSQALALFNKAMRKFTQHFKKIYQSDIEKDMKKKDGKVTRPHVTFHLPYATDQRVQPPQEKRRPRPRRRRSENDQPSESEQRPSCPG